MPALTFTADSTTNQLTITGHNFNNGDGPVTPYTETGTLPTGSPAITALTDYWVKVDDANHVKLAISQANALAGTTIDITANGSGTLKLLYDLPYRRPATVTAGSQVKGRYFNSQAGDAQNRIGLFDTIIALWNAITGQSQSVFPAGAFGGPTTEAFAPVVINNALSTSWQLNTGNFINSTGSGAVILSLPTRLGRKITGLAVLALGNGTTDATIDLNVLNSSLAINTIGTLTDSNRSGSWGLATVTVTPHDMVATERLALSINANASGYQVGSIFLTHIPI
jgi:hypothetical protein